MRNAALLWLSLETSRQAAVQWREHQGKINEHIPHEKKNLKRNNTKFKSRIYNKNTETVFKEQKARDIKRKTAEECGLE